MEPLDCVMIGQTNDGAYDRFIKEQADPNKFTRRLQIINVPYITSVSEEEALYEEFIEAMRDKPHFDPMTLKIAALLAVISRMKQGARGSRHRQPRSHVRRRAAGGRDEESGRSAEHRWLRRQRPEHFNTGGSGKGGR